MSTTVDGNAVRESTLGDELDKNESVALAGIMGARKLRDGELLVAENAADHALYLLAEGRLEVLSQHCTESVLCIDISDHHLVSFRNPELAVFLFGEFGG